MHCTFQTRVPESVLKGDDDDALEELGASLAGVNCYTRAPRKVSSQ
jgi:hypothetical protein